MFKTTRTLSAKMSFSKMQDLNPKAQFPLILNAPMAGTASPAMAAEVTNAGGFGFLGCAVSIAAGSPELAKLDSDMADMRKRLENYSISTQPQMPVGVGFVTGSPSIGEFGNTALSLIRKHTPAAVWLFAPEEEANPHPSIISALRNLSPRPKVFVQVGTVQAARDSVSHGADVLVCQGSDAGGHQFRKGQGVVSLVAAVKDMLKTELGPQGSHVGIMAAGGIANGDGVAAAIAMGVDGVIMGTRFTVAEESNYPEVKQQAILTAKDGTETLKSPFHDQLVNSSLWGPLYDGRAIMTEIHEKFNAGASLEDCQKSLEEDYPKDVAPKMVSLWAGTGVGLVNKKQKSADIVKEVRQEATEAIQRLTSLLGSIQ